MYASTSACDPPRCVCGGWCACMCVGVCTETCEHCVCVLRQCERAYTRVLVTL